MRTPPKLTVTNKSKFNSCYTSFQYTFIHSTTRTTHPHITKYLSISYITQNTLSMASTFTSYAATYHGTEHTNKHVY